jgi:uncharacterized protein involved in outer membrane biogenesis
MKATLRWGISAVAVLAIAIVLVVIFFDWNWLKSPLQSRLSALTGKHVTIDGPITGTKHWIPHIVLNQVRIEEPSFPSAPKVATIDSLAVEIDLKQLLRGRLSFPLIDIQRPNLNLERTADGKTNWDIAAEASGPDDRSAMPLIGHLKLENGKILYRDLGKHTEIDGTIATIGATGGNGEGSFTLDGHGNYGKAPFTIKLKGGSLNDLRNTRKPWDVDASAAIGKTSVSIVGTITDPFKLTDMLLKLTADGDNAEELYPLFGIPAPTTPPYHLVGTLDRDGKAWLFKDFAGTVGKTDLEGSLRFDVPPYRPRLLVSGNLRTKSLDFADLGLLVGAPGDTKGDRPMSDTQKQLAKTYAQSDRVLPDAPLNLKEVRDVDADITFKGDQIKTDSLPLDNLDLHLKLDNGILSLNPLHVGVAGGLVDADVTIDARSDVVGTDYDVRFHKFKLEDFFAKAGFTKGGSGFIDGRIRLKGSGDSVRRSLASSNGEASAIVNHGTISNLAADILGLDVAKALGVYIAGDKQIPLHCLVADFKVENGLMTPRTFVLDTDATLVTGTGSINLANEHLDLAISGQPKSPSPIALGGPIDIGGTFKSPDVGLGAKAIARGTAATALAIVLTPLAAILGFIETGDSKDADCMALVQSAQTNENKKPVKPMPVHARPGPR